jgi:uncharacterized protein (TIGR02217 family)
MMSGFHEIRFPARVALGATGGPVRRTDIVNLSNGREQRNQRWCDSRRSYDVGTGIRSICDLYQVLEFFEARGGQLYGFRFRDPVDWVSCVPGGSISALDQVLGAGDGTQAVFALVKTYGDAGGAWTRRIAKPVAGTVVVSVMGRSCRRRPLSWTPWGEISPSAPATCRGPGAGFAQALRSTCL